MFRSLTSFVGAVAVLVATLGLTTTHGQSHTSKMFQGPKANTGTVTHARQGNKETLALSADFKTPDTPDPHWQIVDSQGRVFLLQRIPIKGDAMNRTIVLPSYIKDIDKVQIYCAWAEVVLGETTFDGVMKLTH